MFSQLAEEQMPMPEMGNHSIGTEILLPRGDEMARVHVVAHSHDANGNMMGRTHAYPIFNTWTYQIEFDWWPGYKINHHCHC